MGHIVDSCPLTELSSGLMRLQEADDETVNWLKTTRQQHSPHEKK